MKPNSFHLFLMISSLILSLIEPTTGQEKYMPGYVISLNGDTIQGAVDYRNWEYNPQNVHFKSTGNDKKWTYSPLNILGFGVAGEHYTSAVVDRETSPGDTRELSYEAEVILTKDTVFLVAIVSGEKALFYLKPKTGPEQFYMATDSGVELLIHKKYLKDQDGRTVVVENKRYVGQLMIFLGDCSTIGNKVSATGYSRQELENLFRVWYECRNIPMGYQKKEDRVKAVFGVLAGISLTALKFKSDDYAYLVYAGYNTSVNFTAGITLDVILSRNQGKWSINNELIFTSFKVSGQYQQDLNGTSVATIFTTIGYSYIKLNNMVRFKFRAGGVYPFINAGISNGFAITETNYMKQESIFIPQEGKALNETRKYEVGFTAGLGLIFRKFSFEARYERGTGMSPYVYLKSPTNRLYFLLGFRFSK